MRISTPRLLSASLAALLLGSFLLPLTAAAQTTAPNEWTWVGGSSTTNQPAVYGSLGSPATGNTPGGRDYFVTWADNSSNFWLFGGVNGSTQPNSLNDLWEFNPSTNEWTWMSGSSQVNQSGSYGTLGKPATSNIPGARSEATAWIDKNGNLWLFGGFGYDANGNSGDLNDLWEFSPSANEWTWVSGSNTLTCFPGGCGTVGVYGTLHAPAIGNTPGGRQDAISWTDTNGNLWLFGGNTNLNDLWEFNLSTSEWAWMGGNQPSSSIVSAPGIYGTLGVSAAGNIPSGRSDAASWTDQNGNFWLFGGEGVISAGSPSSGYSIYFNDLWEFYPSSNEWAWMGGSDTVGSGCTSSSYTGRGCGLPGTYGTMGSPAVADYPGSRKDATSWTDKNGNFWLFGGWGYDNGVNDGYLNDIWAFDPSINEWTWMGGLRSEISCVQNNCSEGQPGVYGALGTPASINIPGGRISNTIWTDKIGNLWLFGGFGLVSYGSGIFAGTQSGLLDDVWEYQLPASVATPQFSISGGTYNAPQTVSISDTTPNATIYYTTNGTAPNISSTQYGSAINVSSSESIQAVAVASGLNTSGVASATYTIIQPGFTITGTPVTVTAGATSGNTAAIALTPVGGFTGNVALTATITSGPSGGIQPTLSFGSTTPASITGAAAGTATLTITTTASSTTQCSSENRVRQGFPWYSGGGAVLACVLLFGVPARRRGWLKMLGVAVLLVALAGGAMACGGGGGGKACSTAVLAGTMPGSYTITVTGISNSITSTGTVSLTVQ